MASLTVIDRAGTSTQVEADTGLTVMEILRDKGFDELLALCGGSCSCATCHVWVDEDHFWLLPRMSRDEDELLDTAYDRRPTSRLSCQVTFGPDYDGMAVTIAAQEY